MCAVQRKSGPRLQVDPPAHGDCTEDDGEPTGLEQARNAKRSDKLTVAKKAPFGTWSTQYAFCETQ